MIVTILHAVLDPMQGVVVKWVTDGLVGQQGSRASTVIGYVPWYVAILVGLAALRFAEKSLKGWYDPLITFQLQRIYLRRRPRDELTAIVSRLQYDCRDARKAIEVYVRDVPGIALGLVTVFALQWSLAPQWLPALSLIVVPNLAMTIWLGRPIRHSNREMFLAVTDVARQVSAEQFARLCEKQESLYGRLWRRETWMGFSEVMMELTVWGGSLIVVYLSSLRPGLLMLPDVTAGEMALLVANVHFLSKPLGNLGKALNKFCSTEPALRRALYE